ncbi:histidine-containing phosphotransfer protein 1 [Brachypodium distachyon]|uniref:Histidine-containing phosphotransfer protein n=1 Tax=Brachypodium distachyon TaxID=15368 RepID=I1HPA5_BRADI|nr:histidine-containing phosphotransfer protein 1 [Brachypodium distachyon]KQK08673.1 hypothetical protein BRADI_2g43167v3 [Brachypodium distachyon]|eukprot:XP_003566868.1 histidine-containing phosphotransfer protein 1 [Brachypodium distachyon]
MATPMDQLTTFLSNMFAEGLLDTQFQELQMIQGPDMPNFISEVITLFCEDGERIINELAKLLDKPCVDFDRLDAIAHRFKGSSASVGALRVKNTCIQLHVFCKEKSLNGCLMTLNTVSNEFYNMRGKFQMILQLEQQVKTYYSKK